MKCAIYAHEIVKLCSKMCLKCVTDLGSVELKVTFYGDFPADSSWLLACMIGLIFVVHANGRSAMDRLIAVMNWLYWMSLDSEGCSLLLDSLSYMTGGSSACPIEQSSTRATTPICRLASHAMLGGVQPLPWYSYYACIVLRARYSLL